MGNKLSKNLVKELKEKLLRDEKMLAEKIERIKKEDPFLDPEHVNDNAAVDTDVREQMEHETIEAQILSMQKRLERVEIALKKVMKDSYGKCESCAFDIKVERLQLMPEARYCIDCEKRLVK